MGGRRRSMAVTGRFRLAVVVYHARARFAARIGRQRALVPISLLRGLFDASWYTTSYGIHVSSPFPDPFEHYHTLGIPAGFSPGPDFDESAYRAAYPDVAEAVERGAIRNGHEHYVLYGRREGRTAFPVAAGATGSTSHPMHGATADAVRDEFDPQWYLEHHPAVARDIARGIVASPLWHYLTEGVPRGLSPNAWFDEPWYLHRYPDVADAKSMGATPNGFVHYLHYGQAEGRRPSEAESLPIELTYADLTRPVGIERLAELDRKLRPFPNKAAPNRRERRVNVLFPTLDRSVLFGGYIAALNFVKRLQDRGWTVRLLITDDVRCTPDRVRKQFNDDPVGDAVLGRAEIVNLARRGQVLDTSPGDSFVAYSMWAAHHAATLARAVGRRHVFFVQEFEPAFHPHDCWHALGSSVYDVPHFAVFNSEFLRRWFAAERIGVYAGGEGAGRASSVVFEHALSVTPPQSEHDLTRGDGPRRMLVYARPEAHAGRNLFEIAVVGLRRAVAEGVFDDDEWQFDGVGSLTVETGVKLGRGHELAIRPRLGLGAYTEALRGYEVGLSLQYTPHPGVVHFEMAASGVMTVTNTFSNRNEADLVALSPNLVPVVPTPDGVASGLAEASRRAKDVAACVEGAAGPWVTSWEDAFDEAVMATIEAELA